MLKKTKNICLVLAFGFILLNVNAQEFKPELYIETGHYEEIKHIEFSSDGRLFGTTGNSVFKLWDTATGTELRSFRDSGLFAFSPNTRIVAISSDTESSLAYSTRLLDVETGAIIKVFEGGGIIFFSFDGNTIANTDAEGNIKLWDVNKGSSIETLFKISDLADTSLIAFSPDLMTVAGVVDDSGSEIQKGKIWDLRTGKVIKTLSGDFQGVNSLIFSPDGKQVAGNFDQTIKLWNTSTGDVVREINGQNIQILLIAFSPDSKTIVGSTTDKMIKIWDAQTGKEIHTFVEHKYYISAVAFSSNGEKLASGDRSGTVCLWNALTGNLIKILSGHTNHIPEIAFSPDANEVALASYDRTIKLFDISAGKGIRILSGNALPIQTFAYSPNGKQLVSGDLGGSVKLWDTQTNQEIKSFEGHSGIIQSVAFSPNGKLVASAGQDRSIKIWEVGTGREVRNLIADEIDVQSISFSPDGKMIVSGGGDDLVKLWDVTTGNEIKRLEAPVGSLPKVKFSPDGKWIVCSNGNGYFTKIWNAKTGTELVTLKEHSGSVYSTAFSPDGKIIATGSSDGTIKLWSIQTGKVIKTFIHSFDYISSIIFTQNGQYIIGAGEDKITIWNVNTGNELVSLVAIDKIDWLVTTPEGFFDGTPNAWKQLIWRFNNNTFDYAPVETYFNDFFYPNLLQDVLAGKSLKPPAGSELEKKDRRQPKVEIASVNGLTKAQMNTQIANQLATDKRSVAVTIEVTENLDKPKQPTHKPTSEVQNLRLFRNGSLVKIWHGETIDDIFNMNKSDCEVKPAVNNAGRKLVCRTTLPIVAGDNNFTAYAFNADNVKSNDDTVLIKGADALKRDGTLYVLAVGVNKYANSAYNLNFAVPDVEEIGAAVKTQQDKLVQDKQLKQYAKTEIITLTNENATRENILLALSRFSKDDAANKLPENLCANLTGSQCAELKAEFAKIKPTEPEDALIIYYAGHGTSRGQRFYLLPHNFTGKGGDNLLEEQGVSDIDLNNYLEKVDAGRLLTVIDACQSGQALGEKTEGRGPMNSKGLAQLAYDKGMLILTAAQSQQSALEVVKIGGKEVRHGLLTYALLEAMKNSQTDADKDGNKQIWEREWFDFATEKVPIFQLQAMKERRVDLQKGAADAKGRSDIIYLDGDDPNLDPEKRRVQTPRVFYRRETEINPLIVAKP